MKTLIITGHEGMLGRMLIDEAMKGGWRIMQDGQEPGIPIKVMGRQDMKDFEYGLDLDKIPNPSIVINAAGVVKESQMTPLKMVYANSVLPHLIAQHPHVERVIQVSTDCVFDGHKHNPLTEADQPKPLDLYGRSKLAGELLHNDNALTVRTSFIGFGQRGLIRWLLNQPENTSIEGYTNWVWNGFYVRTVARLLLQLALESEMTGLLHLEGSILTKGELLVRLAGLLRPDVTVTQGRTPEPRWMVLGSDRISGLEIPSWQEQWEALKQDAFDLDIVSLGQSL